MEQDRKKSNTGKNRISFFHGFKNPDFALKEIDRGLLTIILILVIFGSFMVVSTVSYRTLMAGHSVFELAFRQFVFVVLGFLGMYFFTMYDYRRIGIGKITLIGIIVLVLNILVYFIGDEKLGATRWISFPGFSLQPSELAKFYILIVTSYFMTVKAEDSKGNLKYFKMGDDNKVLWKRFMIVSILTFGFTAIIGILQSNFSTGAITFSGYLYVLFISGLSFIFTSIPLALGILGGAFLILSSGYRRERILNHLKGTASSEGVTQIQQSLYAMASGGFFGRGFANSRFKANWLPIAENDFIFAIISEEWGYIGSILIIGAFYFLAYRGFKIASSCTNPYGKLLAGGITFIVIIQALVNLMVVTGLGPVTGVPLPFISQGGTSLVVNMSMMGIILNISRSNGEGHGKR